MSTVAELRRYAGPAQAKVGGRSAPAVIWRPVIARNSTTDCA